jgi:hypothetical protein
MNEKDIEGRGSDTVKGTIPALSENVFLSSTAETVLMGQ